MLLIASLTKEQRERYEKIRGRFESIDYTSAFHIGEDFKVIGFYGRLLVENLEIKLAEFTTAFFVEATGIGGRWRTQSLSLLRTFGWQFLIYADKELVAAKRQFQIRLKWFTCAVCNRSVFACLLCYPNADTVSKLQSQYPWCSKHGEETMMKAYRLYEVRTEGKDRFARETNLEEAARLLSGSRAVALTGAGISKASGISTFSGPDGLETRLKLSKDEFFQGLFEEPEFVAKEAAKFQVSFMVAKPNPAHLALAELERMGVITSVITENGDGLHQERESF